MQSGRKRFNLSSQVSHMVAFMEQEGHERVQEIDDKTEEEYHMTVGDLIQVGRTQLKAIYDRKEATELKNRTVQKCLMIQQAKMEIFRARQLMIQSVVDLTVSKLEEELSTNQNAYKNILHKLILQAAVELVEPVIGLRVRERDRTLIDNSLLAMVNDGYKVLTGLKEPLEFEMDNNIFLSASDIGGVVVFARQGRILVNNTLGERIARIAIYASPAIRMMLFENSEE